MITNIHTHNRQANAQTSVINLNLEEAAQLFAEGMEGNFSIGVHPWQAHLPINWNLLETLAADSRIFAIGECGLDKYAQADNTTQTAVFVRQIQLAEQLDKPLIIHCVGRFNELIQLRKNTVNPDCRWIVHGFRGKPELTQQLLKAGFYLSFGQHYNIESFQITPPERRYTETDEDGDETNQLKV